MSTGQGQVTGKGVTQGAEAVVRAIAAGPQPKPGAKPDELALWRALEQGEKPRDAGQRLGIPSNRVAYLCGKWAQQRIYEYGVTVDLGWIVQ